MIVPILGLVLALELGLGLLLVSKVPPLEKLACLVIDLTKTTKGSVATKTLAGTFAIFLASSVSTYARAQARLFQDHSSGHEGHGHIGPAEMIILRTAELESILCGSIMVLAFFINRVHYYLRGKRGLTLQLEVLSKQVKRQAEFLETNKKSGKDGSEEEIKSLKEIIADLREKVEKLQVDVQNKEKDAKAAEVNAQAIRKQSEGMALEYERLLEDHENLRLQVSSFDRQHSRSTNKKDT